MKIYLFILLLNRTESTHTHKTINNKAPYMNHINPVTLLTATQTSTTVARNYRPNQ